MIINEVSDQYLYISEHARDQWEQRAGLDEGQLEEHVRKAVPFGGQFGNNVLFCHKDWVFPTVRKPDGRVVTTVLPYAFAVANMQAKGMQYLPPSKPSNEPVCRRKAAEF